MKNTSITFLFLLSLLTALLSGPLMAPVSTAQAQEELITMNFEDADIRILIKFISELVQKNFIIDDKIKGKVTIISPEKITITEAYRVFESILEVKGFTLVSTGKVIKIVPKGEAVRSGIKTDVGKTLLKSEQIDEYVTRITRLEYVNVNDMLNLIRPLLSKEANIQPYASTNTLIITEIKSNLYRILKIINELDVKGYRAELYVLPLKYASVKTVTEHLNNILEQATGSKTTARPTPARRRTAAQPATSASVSGVSASAKIIPDERTNSLIVLATRNDYNTIIRLVEKLDVEAPEGKGRINIYYLQNAVADEIVTVLNEFISGIKAEQQQAGGQPGAAVRIPTQTDIKIVADNATNALIINADTEDYEQLKSVIEKLDIPRSQVLIEALIMEVRGTDNLAIGVEWEAFGGQIGTDDSIDRLAFGGSLTSGGQLPGVVSAINEGTIPGGLSGFNLGVFGNFITFNGEEFPSISALITAVSTRSDTNIVATPQILTMDNEEAEIKVGENRPFLTQARTGDQGVNDVFQTFDFRDVGVTLRVTPHISQSRSVRLEIFQEISNVNQQATEGTGATAPVTTKRSADTTVVIQDGHTIVIGGLIQDDLTDTTSKVPCLGDLPLIGYLFRSISNSNSKTSLMIFLTPHIITNPIEAARLSEGKHKKFESFKLNEGQKPDIHFYGPLDLDDSPTNSDNPLLKSKPLEEEIYPHPSTSKPAAEYEERIEQIKEKTEKVIEPDEPLEE